MPPDDNGEGDTSPAVLGLHGPAFGTSPYHSASWSGAARAALSRPTEPRSTMKLATGLTGRRHSRLLSQANSMGEMR